jgi:drug/metabolite transporter (DMT)-like permease
MTNRLALLFPHLGFVLVYIFWGINTPFMKLGGREWDPITFNGIRFLLVIPFLWLISVWIMRRNKIPMSITRHDLLWVVFLSILSGVGMEVLLAHGLQYSNSANSAVLGRGSTPIITAVIALFMKDIRLSWRIALGLPLAFISVLVIVSGNGLSIGEETLKGDAVLLLRGFLGALYLIVMTKLIYKYAFYWLITLEMTVSAIILFPFVVYRVDASYLYAMSNTGWVSLFYCAFIGGMLGFLIHNWSLSKLGPFKSSVYGYLLPLTATLAGWLMLGERLGINQIIGGIGVLFAMWLVQKDRMDLLKQAQHKMR